MAGKSSQLHKERQHEKPPVEGIIYHDGTAISLGPSRVRIVHEKSPEAPIMEELSKEEFYNQLTAWGHVIGHVLQPPKEPLEEILEKLRRLDKGEAAAIALAVRSESNKPPQSLPSTQDAVAAYLTRMEDDGAAEGYLTVRARKLRFFARQHPKLPTDPEVIRSYLRQFKTKDVPTRKDQWTALTALYKFASRTYGIVNPMLDVDKPRFKKKQGQRLSRDQAKSVLAATRTGLEWALVTCYFGMRFRRVEAERLLLGHVKSDYIIVQGKERTEELPLLPVFRDKLLKLKRNHRPDDPLFPIKGDTMAYHIKQIFKRAGISGVRGSTHTLRNTAGALWSTFGGDWTSNRQLLRHSEQKMTDHYSPLTIDELMVKDDRHNPMLNLLRELALEPTFTDTTGVRETEAASQIENAISTYQATTSPAQLPEILDELIALGQRAQELRHSLGGNGHWPEELKEVMQYLEHRAR